MVVEAMIVFCSFHDGALLVSASFHYKLIYCTNQGASGSNWAETVETP